MLLTRSRLCPRPKPGSSLHLHVLGTPPAFVLSQDQTLREELLRRAAEATRFTKSRQGRAPPSAVAGPGPVRWWDQAPASTRGDPMYTTDPGTQDGVFNLAPSPRGPRGTSSSDGVEPGHTSRPRGRSKSAHAVEFSKTVAPLREGDSFPGRVRERFRSRSGPVSIAPPSPCREGRSCRRDEGSVPEAAAPRGAAGTALRRGSGPAGADPGPGAYEST